jgi:VWFA-related protein
MQSRRRRPRNSLGVAALCIVPSALLVVLVASARQEQPQRPVFRTEVNYVRVDVYPTADGVPVGDLRQDDFEVFDDGVPQKIEQFERVEIRGNVPQDLRRDPNTVAESRALLENSRARVFVLFLDNYHVEPAASRMIRKPLLDTLDRLISEDDIVGVMTPRMSAADVTFARKTTTIRGILDRYWWGERDLEVPKDPIDQNYCACFPDRAAGVTCGSLAQELIARRHETLTLDALEDLVRFLRGVREERKAILAITPGWRLFRPDPSLLRDPQREGMRAIVPPGVDPNTGKLTTKDTIEGSVSVLSECDRDRMDLALIDHEPRFRLLLDEANRANASFYPIDPRGLAVFDSPINNPLPLDVDRQRLGARIQTLRTLAEATDGVAVVDTNGLSGALKRVVADLSSYYLLGYYATNAKLDGKFHAIKVRVKRPGVQVRARRGYVAPTAAELATRAGATRPPADPLSAAAAAEAHAVEAVVAPLVGFSREVPIRVQVVAGWTPAHTGAMWVVGEFGAGQDWAAGGEADVTLTSGTGATVATAHAQIEPRSRSFRVALAPSEPMVAGDYAVRVRARSAAEASLPVSDAVRVAFPRAPDALGAIFVRRGPVTGNKEAATADLRFRRSEHLRVEIPTPTSGPVSARLLDRTGKPLMVPVTALMRDEADGSRWQTAQLALAPLAPGDYVIELAGGAGGEQKRTLVGFRVVP